MQREMVMTGDAMSMWFYPSQGIVHHEFHTYMFGEPLRTGLMQGADLLRDRGASKWLSDDRKNSALHPDDVEWAKTVWFPTALQNGWKHWAVVWPQKVVGQMNMKDFMDTYRALGINAEAFADPTEAMLWLRRQ